MATNSTYYLDAADLATATAVYLDSSLAFLAPDGFYGDGTISRQQSLGILLPSEDCVSPCPIPCGGSIGASGGQGIYLANLDTGSDVGAIVIYFNPDNIPDGIRVIYDGNTYNTLSSPVDGLHKSTDPTGFTVVGYSAADCGLSGNITNFPAAIEYLYNGTSFAPTGNTQSITLNPGDISLGSSPPQNCIMVIPKVNASPSVVSLQMLGPCSGTVWSLSLQCPYLLPDFSSSTVQPTASVACDTPLTQTYYSAKVHTSNDAYVGLYDYVFEDAYGAMPLADGFYLTDNVAVPNQVLQVQNGIVVAITNCVNVICTEYTLWTVTNAGANYTDCGGNPQTASIGGASGYTQDIFCAIDGTVVTSGDANLIVNGPCNP